MAKLFSIMFWPGVTLTLGLTFTLSNISCKNNFSKKPSIAHITGNTMGTNFSVKFLSSDSTNIPLLEKKINTTLVEINKQMSTYIPTSEISKLNQAKANTPIIISPWFSEVLKRSLNLAKQTSGYFDPTIGPLVNLWGFGPKKSQIVPSEKKIKEILSYIGYKKLKIQNQNGETVVLKSDDKTYIDLSASAKGFAVDKISELLTTNELPNHLVEIGGEIRASGFKQPKTKKHWVVAIEAPSTDLQQRSIQKTLPLLNASIATSGSYRIFFESKQKKYSHTINPETGQATQHGLLSVSIITDSCLESDSLATALMAMGPKKAWSFILKNKIAAYLIIQSTSNKKLIDSTSEKEEKEIQVQMSNEFKQLLQ